MTKQTKLTPNFPVKSNPSLPHKYIAEIDSMEILELRKAVRQMATFNNAVAPSVGKWLAKNNDNLLTIYEKLAYDEQQLKEKYSQYFDVIEKTAEGKAIFYDGNEDEVTGIRAIAVEVKEEVKMPNGQVVPKITYQLTNISNGSALSKDIEAKMKPYIKDAEKEKVYYEKKKEYEDELAKFYAVKHKVELYNISETFLTETRFAMPTSLPGQNGPDMKSIGLLYKYLIEEPE